jgi:hypothetical protein
LTVSEPDSELYALDFDAAKSMRYHLCRRRWWDTWNRANKIMGALSGSAVVVGITSGSHWLTTLSGIVVATFSVFDLVFDFSERAREADALYRKFSLLAQEIAIETMPSEASIARLRRHRLQIEMEEAPPLDLLERRCCREEALARGHDVPSEWDLTRWEQRRAQFVFWTPAREASAKRA